MEGQLYEGLEVTFILVNVTNYQVAAMRGINCISIFDECRETVQGIDLSKTRIPVSRSFRKRSIFTRLEIRRR